MRPRVMMPRAIKLRTMVPRAIKLRTMVPRAIKLRTMIPRTIAGALLMLAAASMAGAQEPRLAARLDPRTRVAVEALVDSARLTGLPTEPLIQKALEGASKRVDGARIVAAVRSLAHELGEARTALGAGSSDAEVGSGAIALQAGVGPATLKQLRAERPRQVLTVPLGVLSELVASGVPADTASQAVTTLAAAGVRDAGLVAYRQEVARDIARGARPGAAASFRARSASDDASKRAVPPVRLP